MTNLRAKQLLFCLLLIATICACNREKGVDIDMLISKYSKDSKDSIKLQAVEFLKENLENQVSEKLIAFNEETGKEVKIDFDTIVNSENLKKTIRDSNLIFKVIQVKDAKELSNEFIEDQINAFDVFCKNVPWTKRVKKDVLLNYLLPYKIYWEEPGDWRNYFFLRNKSLIAESISDNLVDTMSLDRAVLFLIGAVDGRNEGWFNYSEEHIAYTNAAPSFKWIKSVRKGDCSSEANANAYLLRSVGIPATVDYVPMWGSRNSGHAAAVGLDSNGNIYPQYRLWGAAKIFRFTFKRHLIWTKEIKPYLGMDSFLINSIKHDHWLDVTSSHIKTSDVGFLLPKAISKKFAYICAYNYGRWQPVFWGKIDQNKKVVFKEMGRNILYCLAIPNGKSYSLYGQAFLLDTAGVVKKYRPLYHAVTNLTVSKVNTGSDSWIKKGEKYTLSYLDENSQWKDHGTQIAERDSIIDFKNLPSNSLYRIKKGLDERNLSRPFIYTSNGQQWY
ncbi:hypothetical protein SAMN05421820_107209 [Pedobacter steynii]|uniref:Transglutaminase-like domain-containing protein n=1 Tax=Pedobacter steynii TaxID=430522 RepID=A0A1H0AUQ2_9SPHI|nr:transglutaminase-like domain-containing protein [Pedobacter steynii]NQX41254.1 transglutaminase domain-containing protein [Pedobacter steynii]SDN37187.1 hypothetical protein SAMN05421820_107209 [Pedobacter steynii]